MKTLELTHRTDIEGAGYWIKLYVNGRQQDCKYFDISNKEKAYKCFDDAIANFEILGKPEIIKTASFNDEVRTVYVSSDSGEAYLKIPDYGSWYDIRTDATLELVEHAMAKAKGDIDKCIVGLIDRKFFAERVKPKS